MKAPKNNIGYKWLNLGRLVPPLVRSSGDEVSSERMLVGCQIWFPKAGKW